MGVNTVKQVLTVALATGETLVLDEKLDAYRHADDGKHVLLLKNSTARYIAPTDFTIAVDGRGKATVTWLNAATLAIGAELNFGVWQYDSTTNGSNSGGSGGSGGDVNLTDIKGNDIATGAGNTDAGTQRVVVATNQGAIAVTGPLTNAQAGALGLAQEVTLQALLALANAGATVVAGEPCSFVYVAANSTDTAAGNANDQLDSIIFVPTSLNPGAVSIEDGAGTNRVLFEGGTGSIVTKHPWSLDMKNIIAGTAWEVTAGADMNLWVFFRART